MNDYKPLPHYITLRESTIKADALGLFTNRDIIENTVIGITHHILDHSDFEGNQSSEVLRTPLGGFCQMSRQHNCTHVLDGGVGKLVTQRKILAGEELSSDFG
jgi:hypothetical protein